MTCLAALPPGPANSSNGDPSIWVPALLPALWPVVGVLTHVELDAAEAAPALVLLSHLLPHIDWSGSAPNDSREVLGAVVAAIQTLGNVGPHTSAGLACASALLPVVVAGPPVGPSTPPLSVLTPYCLAALRAWELGGAPPQLLVAPLRCLAELCRLEALGAPGEGGPASVVAASVLDVLGRTGFEVPVARAAMVCLRSLSVDVGAAQEIAGQAGLFGLVMTEYGMGRIALLLC
jgi:hypothetical protein